MSVQSPASCSRRESRHSWMPISLFEWKGATDERVDPPDGGVRGMHDFAVRGQGLCRPSASSWRAGDPVTVHRMRGTGLWEGGTL